MRWNISILTLLLFINQFQREFWYNSNISCTSSAAAGARLSSDTEQQWENARREIPFYERAELICGTIERMRWLYNVRGIQWNWIGHTHPKGWKMFIYHIIVLEPITRRRRKDFKPSPNLSRSLIWTTPPKSHNFWICAKIRNHMDPTSFEIVTNIRFWYHL